ncbi:acyltransferase family protein [Myroides profundi]|uniref:Peptidoglycan/LPS O-acetylase OafA/YrhL, contains acyltransferase and SGNH-hydrolase domains n=1 Tax=Myroides profundi TaxID=480520 RepID=A0AAJ4W714_MYRPR|nr:acyltransferase family protein [Myroides profundi]AJH15309.1 acyltransferase [Myroides profundi]SER65276.1 Peptidoglycan/LPS O-acetylase OafA/YrhL, contains acyltransferase and SGNH-hydrolase domains [Myroides profundi]
MGFRYDIQGLRALAVLLVFIFHLNSSWLTGGFVGVDIFFVISGFLVSSIILYKKEKGTFGFIDFYIGRIKRIVPVFLLLLVFVGIVGAWVYLSGDIQSLRKNMFHAAIFNSNNYLASLDNYFGASSQENPLLHTWTLSIEMQFYFLLPLFLILVNRKYIVPVSLFIIITLFGYSFYNSTFLNNQSAMYFSLIARIPEFLIGTVFAIKAKEIKILIGNRQSIVSILSLIGIVLCGVFYTEYFNFPGLWVILPCVFTGIILITTESKVNAFFSNKLLVHIGELSYSIYLWHWAIMAFVRYYFVRIDFMWYEVLFIIVLTYTLSWLSYTFVENIFRTYDNKKFFLRFGGIIGGLGIVVFGMPRLNNYLSPIPMIYSKPTFGLDSHGPTFLEIGVYGALEGKSFPSICLIGDSHALAYKGFLDEIGKMNDFSFSSITNDRVPTFKGIRKEEFQTERLYDQYKRLSIETDSILKRSNLIIICSIWAYDFPSNESALENLIKGLRHNQRVLLLGDYPVFDINPLRINRSIVQNNHYGGNRKYISKEQEYINQLLNKYPDKLYKIEFDFNKDKDLPFINDTIAYYDDGHWNIYGSRKLGRIHSEEFIDFLKKNNIQF